MALATPTSPWQILVARLALVFGYNLVLALAASLALLPVLPGSLLGSLILGWLGPMTFLSAVALAFSFWLGNDGTIAVTYPAWIGKWIAGSLLNDPKAPLSGALLAAPFDVRAALVQSNPAPAPVAAVRPPGALVCKKSGAQPAQARLG
jgi:hypothetical protein